MQNRARRGQARRGRGTWLGMLQKRQTGLRRRKNNKMWKAIESSRRGTLSGEVTAGQKRSQRGHVHKGQGAWRGMQRGWQAIPSRMKKNRMRQGITNSRQGTLSGEVTAGENKILQRRPQARWGFPEERQEDLQNRQLRCQRMEIHQVKKQRYRHYTG